MNPTQPQFDQDTLQKIKQAQAMGHNPDEVIRKATAYQAAKQPQTQPKQAGNSNMLLNLLPVIGGIGGSFIPGAGTIVGGAAGAGLGALLKQVLEGDEFKPGEVAKEAAFAGAGGVAGKALGGVASKVLPGISKFLTGAGDDLAVRAFRASPSQLSNFATETGEDLGTFLTKRGLTSPEQISTKVGQLQKSFDDIVLSKNLSVSPDDILTGFSQQIDRLNKSINPADQQKAQVITKIAENFINQYGKGPIPANALTALRREIDQGIKEFSLDQAVKGPLNLTRDIFQESLRDAADSAGINIQGQSLKETGLELSKLYKALEIGERQSNLGRGSMPLGITRLIGGALGGATGGLPGVAAGIAATEALNNPATIGVLSRLATKGGNIAGKIPGVAASAIPTIERGGVATGAMYGQQEPQIQDPTKGQAQFPLTASEVSSPANPGPQSLKEVIGTILLTRAKTSADVVAALNLLDPKDSAAQQKSKSQIKDAESIVDQVFSSYFNLGGTGRFEGNVQKVTGALGVNPKATAYDALRKANIAPLARAISGEVGVLTDFDIARVEGLLPKLTDTPEEARLKYEQIMTAIRNRQGNVQQFPLANEQPTPVSY